MAKFISKSLCSAFSLGIVLASCSGIATRTHVQASANFPSFLTPCRQQLVDGEALCGKYEVYEDRAAQTGRKIALNIVVLPALNKDHAPDPVFWLHGGPGAAATQATGAAKGGFLERLRPERDLVFVDQRGTGASNGLKCEMGDDPSDLQSFFGPLFPFAKVRECRARLEQSANLRLYTTTIAMDDLDEVRAALGYGKINLVAGSYGTIAAQVYMRQHLDHLRAVFMLGVANTNIRQPLPFAAGAQHALDRLFEDCDANRECQRAFPNLRNEFAVVLARFRKGPVNADLINPKTKAPEQVQVVRGNFVERIRLLLYTTNLSRYLPLVIHAAFQNNYLPFESLAIQSNLGAIVSRGVYLTVTCSESIPFITERDIQSATKGTFVGEYRVQVHIQACKEWPKGTIAPSYIQPTRSDVPTLLVSGELDPSTPPRLATEAIARLSNARLVRIKYYGHQIDNPCVWELMRDFIAAGTVAGLDATCVEKIKRPPFVSELPKAFELRSTP